MGLLEDIKADMDGKRNETGEEWAIKTKLNNLFYLPKKEKEADLIKHILTRGTGDEERKGLHANMILEDEKTFCYRKCVLASLYRQKQRENIDIDLLCVFEEGNAVHEKWQRLFLRGGLTDIQNCDRTCYDDFEQVYYSPDIIAEIDREKFIVEIKSMCSFAYKKLVNSRQVHASAYKQIQLYMYFTQIKKGIILCENKDTQEFMVKIIPYRPNDVAFYVDRMSDISLYRDSLQANKKMVRRVETCTGYNCAKAVKCPMREVCYKKSAEML